MWQQAVFLAHFELGPGDDQPGLDVLPAVGAVVAMKAPGVLTVGGVCPPSLHLRGYALPECRVIPQRAHVLRRSGLLP